MRISSSWLATNHQERLAEEMKAVGTVRRSDNLMLRTFYFHRNLNGE